MRDSRNAIRSDVTWPTTHASTWAQLAGDADRERVAIQQHGTRLVTQPPALR